MILLCGCVLRVFIRRKTIYVPLRDASVNSYSVHSNAFVKPSSHTEHPAAFAASDLMRSYQQPTTHPSVSSTVRNSSTRASVSSPVVVAPDHAAMAPIAPPFTPSPQPSTRSSSAKVLVSPPAFCSVCGTKLTNSKQRACQECGWTR